MTSEQQTSFAPGSRPPLARRSDADSAHLAADRLESSGALAEREQLVHAAVKRFPGRTSRQLSELAEPPAGMEAGTWRHVLGRALPALWARGVLDRIEADSGIRWWVTGTVPPSEGEASRFARPHRQPSEWQAALSRARARFRAARFRPSPEDLAGAAGIEQRLARVYRGLLVARLLPDGRVETKPPDR